MFDWSAESNNAAPGWAEAAGERLSAAILWHVQDLGGPVDLQLIGYSRGAVVNSEAHRRLSWHQARHPILRERIRRIDVTLLDPHPANGSAGFASTSPFLAGQLRTFERLAVDPDVVLWPGTASAELYYQHAEPVSEESPLNPWGLSGDSSLAGQLDRVVDLTGRTFVTRDGRTVPIDHDRLPEWYVQELRSQTPGSQPRSVSTESQPAAAAAIRPIAIASESDAEPVLFNGDFCHSGQVADWLLRLAAEPNRIPGWTCTGDVRVASNGRLRLRATVNSEKSRPAVAMHDVLFIPAGQAELDFALHGLSQPGSCNDQLHVSFVPVQVDELGNLQIVSDDSQHQRLGTWQLADLQGDRAARPLSVSLPPCDSQGRVGHL